MNSEEAMKLHEDFRETIIAAQMNYRRKYPDDPILKYVRVTDAGIIFDNWGLSNWGLSNCGLAKGSVKETLENYIARLGED